MAKKQQKQAEQQTSSRSIADWKIEDVKPYERNPRQNDAAVSAVATSIKEFGFRSPILVDSDGVIICGHTRLKAAAMLGMETVPVLVADDLPPAKVRALRIADNKTSEAAEWDDDLLRSELAEIGDDVDMRELGFTDDELASILAGDGTEGQTDEDAEPQVDRADEMQAKWGTATGQVWKMGRHRLCIGDSADVSAISALMHNERADVLFTSPPYGQQRDYRDGIGNSIGWDGLMRGVFDVSPCSDSCQILVNLGLIHDGGVVEYWHPWLEHMIASGWRYFGLYVWDQGPGLPGDWAGRLAPSFEFVFHMNKQAIKPNKTQECKHSGLPRESKGGLRGKDGVVNEWSHKGTPIQDTKIPDSVCRTSRAKSTHLVGHPAMFSVPFAEYFISAWNGIVYEPFCGSGTTIVACEHLGRECRAMEISPGYAAITLQRFSDAFDLTPELLPNG